MESLVLFSQAARTQLMGRLTGLRTSLVEQAFDTLEVLTGHQVVGVVALELDGSLTIYRHRVDDQLAEQVDGSFEHFAWNAPKSL